MIQVQEPTRRTAPALAGPLNLLDTATRLWFNMTKVWRPGRLFAC
jgi:hypothetical protein